MATVDPYAGLDPLAVITDAFGGAYGGYPVSNAITNPASPGLIQTLIQRIFNPGATPPTPPGVAPAINPALPAPPRMLTRQAIPATPGAMSVGIPTMPQITAASPNLLPQVPALPAPPQINVPAPTDFGPARKALDSKADTSAAAALLDGPGINTSRIEQLLGQRTDTSGVRALLDQMKPDAAANMANVFGGLASGAGSVPATEAGSFARALAAAGAGGMGGLAKSGAESREYAAKRAGAEFDLAKLATTERGTEATGLTDIAKLLSHERIQKASGLLDIARIQSGERGQDITGNLSLAQREQEDKLKLGEMVFNNALSQYNTNVKNELSKYEQLSKTQQLLMPKVQHDANGITLQTTDPETGKINVQFHNTKTTLDTAEKLKPLFEAFNVPGEAAEAGEAQYVLNTYQSNPLLAHEALKNLAVRKTISNGAGGSVFGPIYDTAVKSATKQLQTENPTLVAKPAEYQQELNSRIASIIMTDPRINDLLWTKHAAPHSVAARLIAQSIQPTENETGAGK